MSQKRGAHLVWFGLLATTVVAVRDVSAAAHPDHALVADADRALAEGDFARAERRLSRIADVLELELDVPL